MSMYYVGQDNFNTKEEVEKNWREYRIDKKRESNLIRNIIIVGLIMLLTIFFMMVLDVIVKYH